MKRTYTVGLDFGTRSMRDLLVDLESGEELGYKEYNYPHGIMENTLPDGTKLESDWALQHPEDYLLALTETVPKLLFEYGVDGESVIGIGIDFTACTVMPLNTDFIPLCLLSEYKSEPHAYVKLWKHHAALGSAIFAAAASGALSLAEAAKKLGKTKKESYKTNQENKLLYDKLYRQYETLHDYFGRGLNPVMKTFKSLRKV